MPVVEATGALQGGMATGEPGSSSVEAAMVEAIKKAQAEGITDPAVIRARIAAAIKEKTDG